MNRFFGYIGLSILLLSAVSCNFLEQPQTEEAIARVNQNYLYKKDLKGILPEDLSAGDSAIFVNNYINNWATEQILLDQAKLNLPDSQQEEFESLVKDYKRELFTEAYKDLILQKEMDTLISEEDIETFFENNRANFKLNEDLVKFRYIYLNKKFPKLNKIKQELERFSKEDQKALSKETLKFKAYSLNDSVWISSKDFYNEIVFLREKENKDFLKENNFLQQEDSLGVYLVKIEEVLLRNENAPLEYAKPTVKQILLNRRKLELSKDFEKEITKDAIKHNKFEIYN